MATGFFYKDPRHLDTLAINMIEFDKGDAKRIQHFLKVHDFARLIGQNEDLNEEELFILETAAYVHDIGIIPAEKEFGSCTGKLQEELGPKYTEKMLNDLKFPQEVIDRVCYLVAHHHSYSDTESADLQILIEADMLVNLLEDDEPESVIKAAYEKTFRTETGKAYCRAVFGV